MGSTPTASPRFVRAVRERLELNQDELGELLGGISGRSVRSWEKHGADTRTRYALAWLILERFGWATAQEILHEQGQFSFRGN